MSLYNPQYKDGQGNIVDLPINAKKLDGYTYNEYSKYYTTSSTTENAFLVTIPYVKALSDGLVIHCQFHTATKSGATLNVNSLGAKGIYYRYATAITTHIVAHNYVDLIYSATIDKWVLLYSYDANSNSLGYQVRTNNGVYKNGASTSCYRYQILVETNDGLEAFTSTNNSTGTSKTQLSPKYIPNGEIRYYSSTTVVTSGANFGATALWQQYQDINLKYSFNISTITNNSPCYIKMSRNSDGTLSPVYSATSGGHPLVFALPTTKDGYYYTYLGRTYTASSVVYLELELSHPTFYYDGGIMVYDGTYLYDWAKASTKPTYTASEVGALPDTTTIPTETTVSNWGFTKNVGTVTKVNNTSPDSTGNVTITIPTVNNGTLTIKGGTTDITTFTANQSGNSTLNITAGSNVSLDTGTANTIKINATDTKYSAGTGLTLTDTTFSVSKANVSTMLNLLDTGSSTPVDADYYISQYVGGGTTTTSYHRRPMSALWNYIKGKGDSTYLGKTEKAANADKLDGNDSTYYQKALPITGYEGKVLKSTTVPGTVMWADDIDTNQTIKVGSTTFGSDDVVSLVAGTNIDSITADTSAKTITINAKDTTYTSKTAVSGGTDVSLVTTGEKYTWNNKMSSLTIATPTTDTEYELLGFTDSSGNTTTINSIGTNIIAKNGNLTFGGNVTISGDLEINGESSRLIFGPTDVMQLIYGKVDKVYNSGSSATKPIFLSSGGQIVVCDDYAGGTAVTLNGTSKAASTASFYAPTSLGANGTLLGSNGSSLIWTLDNRSLLHHDLGVTLADTTTDSGWSMFNPTYTGYLLKSVRFNAHSPAWGVGDYGAGIIFGGADTKGVISASYGNPNIKFAGGNGSGPRWWIGLTGTSETTYDLDKLTYAPTSAGPSGHSLKSSGYGAPRWAYSREVQLGASISSGAKNCSSVTFVITNGATDYQLNKGLWYYSGTYGVFIVYLVNSLTSPGSPKTEYISGYVSSSIPNNTKITLIEL